MKLIPLVKTYKKPILVVSFISSLLVLINFNILYMTGYGYAEYCWSAQQKQKTDTPKDFREVIRQAKEQIKAKQCDLIADRALFGRGYIMAGNPQYAVTPELKAIQEACPNAWNEIPALGFRYWVINQVIEGNSLSLVDRFLPANMMIERMIDKQWGNCPSVREKVGIPKLIEKSEGQWEFETECVPCKAEKAASEAQDKEPIYWHDKVKK